MLGINCGNFGIHDCGNVVMCYITCKLLKWINIINMLTRDNVRIVCFLVKGFHFTVANQVLNSNYLTNQPLRAIRNDP